MITTPNWFDPKHSSGQAPSLEDIARTLNEHSLPVVLPDRIRHAILMELKEDMFRLEQKGNYSPALHARVKYMLFSVIPIFNIFSADNNEYKSYVGLYIKIIEKHRGETNFNPSI